MQPWIEFRPPFVPRFRRRNRRKVSFLSNAGVYARKTVRWVRLRKQPITLSVELDHSKVFTDVGTASLSFFVTKPLRAHGFRNIVMDVREVLDAQFRDDLPAVDQCAA